MRAPLTLLSLASVLQIVIIMVWAGFFTTQALLWWEFGWKVSDVSSQLLPACLLACASCLHWEAHEDCRQDRVLVLPIQCCGGMLQTGSAMAHMQHHLPHQHAFCSRSSVGLCIT